MHTALRLAEEATVHTSSLPFTAAETGLLTFGALLAMLGVTYAFRSIGTRH